jgi:hypothetical protein
MGVLQINESLPWLRTAVVDASATPGQFDIATGLAGPLRIDQIIVATDDPVPVLVNLLISGDSSTWITTKPVYVPDVVGIHADLDPKDILAPALTLVKGLAVPQAGNVQLQVVNAMSAGAKLYIAGVGGWLE